jgi:uncharacterized membrane protein YoaK (UPF0700 family)
MLRHTGNKRSFRHDLRLAVLLCMNAGFINAAGFLAFSVLTTNVTGHAALLAVYVATDKWRAARMVSLWLLLFLAGAFSSAVYIRRVGTDKPYAYTAPIIVIILVLLFMVLYGHDYDRSLVKTEYFAGSLLFAMGMQNALVSMISGSTVRTTHLTGMFTDLGIDLSQALRPGSKDNKILQRRIGLRVAIIVFFLLGGVAGGLLFIHYEYTAFLVPVLLLITAMVYDRLRVGVIRKLRYTAGRMKG